MIRQNVVRERNGERVVKPSKLGVHLPFERQTVLLSVMAEPGHPIPLGTALNRLSELLGDLRLVVGFARTGKREDERPDIFMVTEHHKPMESMAIIAGSGMNGHSIFLLNDPLIGSSIPEAKRPVLPDPIVQAEVLLATDIGKLSLRTMVGERTVPEGTCAMIFDDRLTEVSLGMIGAMMAGMGTSWSKLLIDTRPGEFEMVDRLDGTDLVHVHIVPNKRFVFDGQNLQERT